MIHSLWRSWCLVQGRSRLILERICHLINWNILVKYFSTHFLHHDSCVLQNINLKVSIKVEKIRIIYLQPHCSKRWFFRVEHRYLHGINRLHRFRVHCRCVPRTVNKLKYFNREIYYSSFSLFETCALHSDFFWHFFMFWRFFPIFTMQCINQNRC